MKMIRIIYILSVLLFYSISLDAQENRVIVSLSRPGQLYELNINAVAGPVTITGYEGKEIVIEAVSSAPQQSPPGRLSHVTGGIQGLMVKQSDNVVTVTARQPARMGLRFKIPFRLTRLVLDAKNSHPINIDQVSGELEITNESGRMNLTNISGSIVASAVHGTITASFRSVNPKAAMAFSILNGNIDLTLPRDIRADLKLRNDIGVSTDFDLKTSVSPAARPPQNGFRLFKDQNWINGTINGGGQQLMVKAVSGRIILRRAK